MNTQLKKTGTDVNYARHDPAFGLATIFTPQRRGRRPGGFSVEREHDGASIKFKVWQALDSRDQSILLAIIGLSGIMCAVGEASTLDARSTSDSGKRLWGALKPDDSAGRDIVYVIRTTRYELLRASGLDDKGRNYKRLKDGLERISMIGCVVQKEGYEWAMHLLSYVTMPDGHMHIALNTRLCDALTGQHVHISLTERRQLKTDTAQLTHAWLSAWLRPSRTNAIKVDGLVEKVWGRPSKHESTNRSRRTKVIDALREICSLGGWKVEFTGRGSKTKATITRPPLPKSL